MMDESATAPALFTRKLWKMLLRPEVKDTISWCPSGKSFKIRNQIIFSQKILPMYFKHNNMGSFIRQLNLYDFHKINACPEVTMEYQHCYFQRDRPDLLKFIRRKLGGEMKRRTVKSDKNISALSNEIDATKAHQENISRQINDLQGENLSLLKVVSNLHKKHNIQNRVLGKLVELLVPFVDVDNSKNSHNSTKMELLDDESLDGDGESLDVQLLDGVNNLEDLKAVVNLVEVPSIALNGNTCGEGFEKLLKNINPSLSEMGGDDLMLPNDNTNLMEYLRVGDT